MDLVKNEQKASAAASEKRKARSALGGDLIVQPATERPKLEMYVPQAKAALAEAEHIYYDQAQLKVEVLWEHAKSLRDNIRSIEV